MKGPGVATGRSGSIGNVFFIEDDFWPLNTALYVKDFHGNDPRFVYYLLHYVDLGRFSSGAGVPTLNRNDVHSERYWIPSNIEEQQRIVAVLDEAFDGLARARAHAEANLQSAQSLFDAFVASQFEALHGEASTEVMTVKDLALPKRGSIRTGPFGSQLLHSEFVDEGIAVLGIDNAVSNRFKWGKSRFITTEKYDQLHRYTVNPGDVIITIMGTCGRCAVVPDDIPVAINTKHLCCISLDQTKCLPGYLHRYFLSSPKARAYLSTQASGSVMDGLNMGIIKGMPVEVPSIILQSSIVEKTMEFEAAAGAIKSKYEAKLQDIGDLRQSLLQKAFAGELI
ncbi:type I restriction-modification system, specificity subunit S [Limimaricola cinnabarinus LL-001]|uniref:Type I restriction-modification system, specificity subunit S n=1 Tax=Limimaricola cinnabarinus LL-001 TaxID=1337093 RepID=U3AIM7_9RHOB|nr:type I restriction-modification system, specificity subunit S [Limimaricola cinnabarinus LL-001]